MLNQPTLQKLQTLRLHGMAEAFRVQSDPAQRDGLADLSFVGASVRHHRVLVESVGLACAFFGQAHSADDVKRVHERKLVS